MCQIGVRPRQCRRDFQRRIQLDPGAARNVGQLQAIDRALREVVAARHDQRFGIECAGTRRDPSPLMPSGPTKAICEVAPGNGHYAAAAAGDHHARAGAIDAGAWVHDLLGRRQIVSSGTLQPPTHNPDGPCTVHRCSRARAALCIR